MNQFCERKKSERKFSLLSEPKSKKKPSFCYSVRLWAASIENCAGGTGLWLIAVVSIDESTL
jgi:hypothetical protein